MSKTLEDILNLTEEEISKLSYVELKPAINLCWSKIKEIELQYKPILEPIEKIKNRLNLELDARNFYA